MAMLRRLTSHLFIPAKPAAYSRFLILLLPLSFSFVLTACSEEEQSAGTRTEQPATQKVESRWYTDESVARGGPIFAQYCAGCHGKSGQGTFAWRQPDADGKYPPPPLNGTAHSWHHPIRGLGSQIKFGAPGGSGKMPGFAQTLSDQDVLDVIAWFQSKWSDEIYTAWLARELQSRSSTQ
jgi:mono/diheme cytochrome c family protein